MTEKISTGRDIAERASFIDAVQFDFDQRQEIERVMEWLSDFPDEAASYIVWLEGSINE